MATRRVQLTRPEYKGSPLPAARRRGGPANEDPPPPSKEGERGGSVLEAGAAASLVESQINEMTPTERLALAERLLAANLGAVEQGRDVDMWATAITEALAGAMKQKGIPAYGFMPVRKVVGAASTWAPVKAFAASAGFEGMAVAERQSAYQLLADLVVRNAVRIGRRSGIPMSLKFVGGLISQLASFFDHEFPGYLESGLASIPFRMRASPATACKELSHAR